MGIRPSSIARTELIVHLNRPIVVRGRDMKKFVEKLRCCSSVAILMSFAGFEATKQMSFYGYSKEYCGGGSVADLMNVTDEVLEEAQIAYICRESLKWSKEEEKFKARVAKAYETKGSVYQGI